MGVIWAILIGAFFIFLQYLLEYKPNKQNNGNKEQIH